MLNDARLTGLNDDVNEKHGVLNYKFSIMNYEDSQRLNDNEQVPSGI